MKRIIILIIPIVLIISSCVKDRLQPANPIVTVTGDSLMYYWNFNNNDSSVRTPAFTRTGLGGASFRYFCNYVDYTDGTTINARIDSVAGSCLRVRNPSDSVIFMMPTTGYKNMVVRYAECASSLTSGPTQNSILYTVDGVNFISAAIPNNNYNLDTLFNMYSFDLSSDPNVNNNPKFAIKIRFNNNNTGTKGNDRFDNVTLGGTKQ